MVNGAVVTNILVSTAVGILYLLVAQAILRRRLEGHARLANVAYGSWWLALSLVSLLGAGATSLGAADLWTLPAYITYVHAVLLLIAVALAALQFYLVFLYTGRVNVLWFIGVFYFVLWLALVYWITWAEPTGLVQGQDGIEPEYTRDPEGSALATALGGLLVVPAMIAALFYFRLYWKVDSRLQRFRIAAVSASIFFWFLFTFTGSLTGADESAWWNNAARAVSILAATLNLLAYRTPRRLAERYGLQEPRASG